VRTIRTVEALRDALGEEMDRDPNVVVYGEDVGRYGGVFKVTEGLRARFGAARVRDTPICEETLVGMAMGAAMMGLRPVAELMYMDFLGLAMDQIVNNIAQARYVYGGQVKLPLVVRMTSGAGANATAQHSKSLEAWLCHVPGIKVVMASTTADAKGLLKAAIREDNPVFFIEHKLLYQVKGEVPDGDHLVAIGSAHVRRQGSDVTIVATGRMANEAIGAAELLERERVSVEVVDPRTLRPLDIETLADSVRRTGRALVVHESWRTGGIGAEIAAELSERCFDDLEAPVTRLGGLDVPIPFSEQLEPLVIPNVASIANAVRELVA
jgi:pyruvate/2-oxoglutarate/acetoin dehydrogenase E1 component